MRAYCVQAHHGYITSIISLNPYSNPVVCQKHTYSFIIGEEIEASEIKEFAE